ncbi:MAG: VWA domain-containing protein [Candidatus Aenigmarchaeota archaeon]|nr:VWA domain-containing protein [Candidatus Aenigmarchaeota archaeon]
MNKGFVKYSLVLVAIGLCLVFFALYGPAEGKGELHDTGLAGETGITKEGPSVEVMEFYEVMDNEGEDEAPPKPEPPEPEETNDPSPKTSGSGGGGGGGSSGGGGGGVQHTPTHKVCNYDQQACIVVQGGGEDECQTYDDCIHTECDYEEEVCLTIDSSGEDECETNEDCIDECIPPYLEVDKEANPTELYCEETTITLTVEGKGEACEEHYPVDVVLVFDNSGSMDDDGWDDNISDWQPIGDAKIAAKTFVDFLGSNDKLGLVSFNTNAKLEQGLTFNKNAVKSAIDGMSAGGWTNMSQGIDYGTQELVANGRVDVPWVEVMLSDGNNNCGSKTPPPDCHQRVLDSVQEAVDNGIVIYTIALGDNANQSLMEDIANLTGGKSYYAPDSEDLEEIYEEIAEEVITTVAGTNVVVIDYLPDYVELNESSLPGECEYNESEREITCELGTVNINETLEISFNVYLYQFGYNLTNVYPDSGVEYLNYNETTVFEEFPETYVTVYGCEHTFCNYVDMICDSVTELEPGEDECETFEDCPHHKICDYDQQACKIVEGAGTDECQTYDNCFHDICDYQSFTCVEAPITEPGDPCTVNGDCYDKICDYGQQICKKVEPGTPGVACESYNDCIHTECNYVDLTCDTVEAPGTDECETFDDCEKHMECDYVGQQCKVVEGAGVDECQTYDNCFHDICNYQTFTCEQKPSTQPGDSCTFDEECFEKVCDYAQQTCKQVEPGTPGTSCNTYDECIHNVCGHMSCVVSNSPGVDECHTDDECIDYICDDMTCIAVPGTGEQECFDDDDCYYMYCDYQQEACLPTPGFLKDECQSWSDCYACGNGVLDPGEECESTGDYAGWGPWGHEYTCKGDNTYYHCVNCQYEHVNECEYYCSGDLECDGHPPMTYLEECDYGYDYLQDYCNEICELEDNNCEDDYSGCTSDPECDELEPDTGDCNYMCQYKPSHMECNYQKLTCELVGTAGEDECETFEDCPHHKMCDYILNQCKIVEGAGTDECQTFDDCEQHRICDYVGQQCKMVDGPGEDQCLTFDECVHTECNYVDLTCDTVPSQGISECQTFNDCPQHKICDYVGQQCKIVAGIGIDECQTYDNCFHDICDYQSFTCVEAPVTEPGDACSTNADCYYMGCEDITCVPLAGQQQNECSQDTDCYHLVCEGMSCVAVPEEAPNECETDDECYYYACDYGKEACSAVPGLLRDECQTYDNCVHNVCNYETLTCDVDLSKGIDECQTFNDCPQHKICDYILQTCKIVQGTGTDECQTYDNCFHDICDYRTLTCESMPKTVEGDPCSVNSDCFDKICDYDQFICKKVEPGTPGDACETWANCEFCGDGTIQEGEECEQDTDCDCPGDYCKDAHYYDYPVNSECYDNCTCADCEPNIIICDERCMGEGCEITVRLEHDQGNKANYWEFPHESPACYDICLVVERNDNCNNMRVPIKYWWCQCPNQETNIDHINYDVWTPKWNRLCTANAGNPNTGSLYCAPCEWRTFVADFRGTSAKTIYECLDVGLRKGTYQIDLREYHDCYSRKAAVALGCAGVENDYASCSAVGDSGICDKLTGCTWVDTAYCDGGDRACSNIRRKSTCVNVGCTWNGGAETYGDYCRGGHTFNCNQITNKGNCNDYTNGKCYWVKAGCNDSGDIIDPPPVGNPPEDPEPPGPEPPMEV